MKILNMVLKSFTCPPIILKIFRPEISMAVEIFTDLDLLSIIEFQIYSFILPILQANLGKVLAKMLSYCVISWAWSEMWDIRHRGYARVSLGSFGEKVFDRAWIRWDHWRGWYSGPISRTAPCLFYRANRQINLPELQFEAKLLRLSGCADFANAIAFRRHRWKTRCVHYGRCTGDAYVWC